jgi:hypothetical protein
VPRPFDPHPPARNYDGPQKGLAPYALWAAMQLAAADESGRRAQSVLVSVVQGIANFSGWFVDLLEQWSDAGLPTFFTPPSEETVEGQTYVSALAACEDLFGSDSREHQLLTKGIVVHHGRMPGRLPRLMVELVERRIIRIVLATSTLTEGVNLPFETILVPGISRLGSRIAASEFANLIGRAGRPGVATEAKP